MKRLPSLILAAVFSTMLSTHSNADHKPHSAHGSDCGSIDIADMNWNSATFIAHVDQFILENGFDCKASLVLTNTQVTGASLVSNSKPDVVPELWGNAFRKALNQSVQGNKLRFAGSPFRDGAIEAFWIPAYMVESTPELKTIRGLIKHADLFSLDGTGKPTPFYGCPTGWSCNISTQNLFQALRLDDANFHFVSPPTGADLDASLQEAYEKKAPWFGYYWSPTAIMGRYDMVQVDFESGVDPEEFKNCTSKRNCPNPKVTMYPAPMVQTVVSEGFAQRAPKAFQYLTRRNLSDSQMNEILAWMEDNQADGFAAMEHFLKNYQSIWVKWVDGSTVRSVRKALDEL